MIEYHKIPQDLVLNISGYILLEAKKNAADDADDDDHPDDDERGDQDQDQKAVILNP